MGLFNKDKSSKKSTDELHDYVDNLLEDSQKMSNDEVDENFSVEAMALKANYGIDHAVALMRDLPADTSQIIVSTVTKTLESANINVSEIIEDAREKESGLDSQIKELNSEIDSLNEQIAKKKDQIDVSTATLEETMKVRGLLESSKDENSNLVIKASSRKQDKHSNVSSVTEVEAVNMALEAQ